MNDTEKEHEFHPNIIVLEFKMSALKEQMERGFVSMGAKLDNFVDFKTRHETASARSEERLAGIVGRIEKIEHDMDEMKGKIADNTMSITRIFALASGASVAGAGIFSLIQFLLK